MPSIINSDDGVVSGSSGLKSTGGNDGILVFQSSGTETARITSGVLAVSATSTTASTVRLYEDTDNGANYVDLVAPTSVASNRVITLPDATTTVVGTDTTQTLTNKTLTSPTIGGTPVVNGSLITSGTAVTATGTAVDFTGIPSWVKRVTVMFNGVSTTGTSGALLQIGSGSIDTTGYVSGTTAIGNNVVGSLTTSTAGILAATSLVATQTLSGTVTFNQVSGNIWVAQGGTYSSATSTFVVAGNKTLSGTLDRVRITTVNGTDTFDAGSINIIYE
jgi:hypothetical protein